MAIFPGGRACWHNRCYKVDKCFVGSGRLRSGRVTKIDAQMMKLGRYGDGKQAWPRGDRQQLRRCDQEE